MSGLAAGLSEPGLATLEALNRLAQSRDRLRRSLADPGHVHDGVRNHSCNTSGKDNDGDANRRNADQVNGRRSDQAAQTRHSTAAPIGTGGWGLLAANPVIGLLLELVRLWWVRQPAPMLLALAGDAAELALQPIARRHPFRLVLGAAAVGAALTALRPWRWVNRSAVTRAVLLALLPQVVSGLRRPPAGGPGMLADLASLAQGAPTPQHTPHHASRPGS